MRIGDALAMPVHWYYDRRQLHHDYGTVRDFTAPLTDHPGSILHRSHWEAPNAELDILGDQRPFWGRYGTHYHQNLHSGENTLTTKIALGVWESLKANHGFDASDSTRCYIDLLTHPERHRDTYLEECHRGFFSNLGRGIAPEKCAVPEKHIGGLVPMLPVALFYANQPTEARRHALEQVAITHAGAKMSTAADAILDILIDILAGNTLAGAIQDAYQSQKNPHFGFPLNRWLKKSDADVIGPRLSTACYVDGAVPAILYLALKYADDPEAGLIANTNLGGDNVHRGAILGALFGAGPGCPAWPRRWVDRLASPRFHQAPSH